MGLVFDPEMYRSPEKQWGYHPVKYTSSGTQWWYADAVYDNGYASSIMWVEYNYIILWLGINVIDPTGKRIIDSMDVHSPDELIASREGIDLQLGENYYRGQFPRYEHHVRDENGNGLDLVYDAITVPTMSEWPEGIQIGRETTPDTPMFMSWFIRPKNKVTGKIIVDGQEIPVTGHGYSDHQYANIAYPDVFQYWYWGTFHAGEHTFVFLEGKGTEKFGFQPFKYLWDWKGDKLFAYYRDCNYYIKAEDLDTYKTESGLDKVYPRKLVLMFEDNRLKGTVTFNHRGLLTQFYSPDKAPDQRDILYSRIVFDTDAKMEIDGEKVETKSSGVIEVEI
jgi:hypothetical protein